MTAFLAAIVKRRGATALRALAVVGLATTLAGCYTQHVAQDATYPDDYRERHPITLKEREHTVEVFVGRNRGGLTAEPARRRAFLRAAVAARRRPAASSSTFRRADRPTTPPPIRCAKCNRSSPPPACRATRSMCAPTSRQATSLASIKINYTKLVAEAGPCGLWPHDLGPSLDATYIENRPYWNLGCASQRNLAAMVDNPADLVQPRGEAPAYARAPLGGDRQVPQGRKSLRHLSAGYDNGKISDLGK